jgi:membrane protein YqaA with SNARE-associated domain
MLQSLYNRVLALSASGRAPMWLAIVAFAEGSFFPLPPDLLLIPMVLARPNRAWRIALLCTIASVCGGALGWFIGSELLYRVALPVVRFYHYEAALNSLSQRFRDYGVWVVLIKGLTPIPYKIVAIASGAAQFSLPLFLLASLVSRGFRFFLLAALLKRFGSPVQEFIEKRLTLVASAVAVAIVGGVLLLKFV